MKNDEIEVKLPSSKLCFSGLLLSLFEELSRHDYTKDDIIRMVNSSFDKMNKG